MSELTSQVQKIFLPKEDVTLEDVERFGNGIGEVAGAAVEIDANRDGDISGEEWLGLGFVFFNQALQNFGSLSGLGLLLTPDGLDAFRNGFVVGFDIQNDEQEAAVEGWVQWIAQTVRLALDSRNAFSA